MQYTWPSHYPIDCPPNGSDGMPGTYYRNVNDNNITTDDFKSTYELNLQPHLEKTNPCARRSTSIWSSFDGAKRILELYPQFESRFIAEIKLRGDHGKVKQSRRNKSHHHWWIPLEVDPCMFATNNVKGPF